MPAHTPGQVEEMREEIRRLQTIILTVEHETWMGRREHDVTQCDLCSDDAARAEKPMGRIQ